MSAIRRSAFLTLLLTIGGTAHAQSALPSTVRFSPITNAAEKSKTVSQIKDDLRQKTPGSTLSGCNMLIDVIEGLPVGHDTSFGAVCRISTQGKIQRVTLCDDRMIGKFFESAQIAKGPEQLGLFVQAHCPPGG